jgi:type 1 glutamine amidotransferase
MATGPPIERERSMNHQCGIIAATLAIGLLVVALTAESDAAGEKKATLKVCLISGAAEYESDASLSKLQDYLEKNYAAKCSRAFAKSESDLPGLENLDTCDVAVLFTRRLKLEGKQLERIKKYCLSGKPLVGIRTASHAVQTWLDLDHEVFGGNYKNHYPEGPLTAVTLVESSKESPILQGVKPYKSAGSLYKNPGVAKDVHVLLTGSNGAHTEPIAWTRLYKGGRVFYTSLGHQKDFAEPSYLRLIANAVMWTAGK